MCRNIHQCDQSEAQFSIVVFDDIGIDIDDRRLPFITFQHKRSDEVGFLQDGCDQRTVLLAVSPFARERSPIFLCKPSRRQA